MGQRRRQAREELERREKNATSGASGGLGPGGEARVAAVKLEELRKQGDALRQQQSVAQNAAWDTARASSKKRRASWGASVSGADNNDEELERTIKVKWSTKKQSHSDHTLDVLFSRFGKVESVSIEEGRGDRAFVTFAAFSSVAAAVEEYRYGETLRANFVGKRRTKRTGVFAPRRQTMSPTAHRSGAANDAEGSDVSQSSFRDRESLVVMKLRQEAERQALIRKMAEQEGSSISMTPGKAAQKSRDVLANEASNETPVDHVNGNNGTPVVGKCVSPSTGLDGGGISSESADGTETSTTGNEQAGGADPIFPVPSPAIARTPNNFSLRRESDLLSAMSKSVAKGLKSSRPPMIISTGGSKSVPTTPASGRKAKGVGAGSIDEGDILARMFATNG